MTEDEVVQYFAFTYNAGKDVTVSDQEVTEFFDSNFAMYGGQDEQVKARHILVATEEEALTVIAELKAVPASSLPADFAELAKKKSTEQPAAKESGGDLGYFTRGQMVPAFEEAAFSQKVGEISAKPVQSDFGFHVILVEDHKEAVKPDFENIKDKVKEDTLSYAKNQKVESYYAKLRQDAKIEYTEDLKPKA
jgi:peptidyl-prolyl cis-trans isomerase C